MFLSEREPKSHGATLIPLGRLVSLLIRFVLAAKPTPASQRSSLLRPLQEKGSQLCLPSADLHLRTWSHSAL